MLAKQIIHNQVQKLSEDWYADTSDKGRGMSKAFAHFCLREVLELADEEAEDAVVDGTGDFNIDAIWFDEPDNDELEITIIQAKYSADFSKDPGIKESDVVKMLASLGNLFGGWERFTVRDDLKVKLAEITAYVQEGIQPVVSVYFCNNGQKWAPDAQSHLDQFRNQTPAHRDIFSFHYLNHDDLFQLTQRSKPVECRLSFRGRFIDQEINYKRVLIGTVPVADIAEIMKHHGASILRLNVREFLGFKKTVNDNIRDTLLSEEKRKNFYFLNNGITIVCKSVGYAPGSLDSTLVRLTDAHIINGGQTSRVIQEVLTQSAQPESEFATASVLTRIYQVGEAADDDGLIGDITLATNSQTAIALRDLHANDPVQIRLESAFKEYGIHYIRKRHQKKVRRGDIRPETLAAIILAAVLKKPHEAKYRKALHFTRLYPRIFDDKRLDARELARYIDLFRQIENARKRPDTSMISAYPFIPFSSFHLLMLMGMDTQVVPIDFSAHYQAACKVMQQALTQSCGASPNTLEWISQLKREPFTQQLIQLAKHD